HPRSAPHPARCHLAMLARHTDVPPLRRRDPDDAPAVAPQGRSCRGQGRRHMTRVADATLAAPGAQAKTIFGQPRGLATLFLTEMWERFTYYGMRGVLILFMVAAVSKGGLGLDDKTASAIYGMYIGGTYLFGLLGGWIADRLLGAQRAVVVGGAFIAAGNVMLALGSAEVFFLGLLVITIGVGL